MRNGHPCEADMLNCPCLLQEKDVWTTGTMREPEAQGMLRGKSEVYLTQKWLGRETGRLQKF